MPYIPIEKSFPDCDVQFKGRDCFEQFADWLRAERANRAPKLVAVVNLHYVAKHNPPLLKVWLYKPAEGYQRAS